MQNPILKAIVSYGKFFELKILPYFFKVRLVLFNLQFMRRILGYWFLYIYFQTIKPSN